MEWSRWITVTFPYYSLIPYTVTLPYLLYCHPPSSLTTDSCDVLVGVVLYGLCGVCGGGDGGGHERERKERRERLY